MTYGKYVKDGYIMAVSAGGGAVEITEDEYNEIITILKDKPTAPDGYGYRLTEALEWEQYEIPIPEITEQELAEEADYITALDKLGVRENE